MNVVSYTSVSRIWSQSPGISSVTALSSAAVAQFASDVEAEINAVIAKRYALPLTVECPILTAIATRESIFRITIQRLLVQFPAAQQGQHVLQWQHKQDQELLTKIAEGTIQLVDSSNVAIAADTSQMEVFSTTKDYLPTFHEGSFENMVRDSNKLQDIEDDREL